MGFAWTPKFDSGFLSRIFGESGRSVFRGGFSISYNRYSMGDYNSIFASNPGASQTANRSQALGNLVLTGQSWPLLFRDKSRLGPPSFPDAPVYPITPSIDQSANAFDPNIRTPYTMSWTFGLQRELTKDMVLELRYVANRNLQPWLQYQLNERNLVENGLLDEFKLAMANLQANMAAGRGNNFRYYGAGTGTSPLPITLAYFSGYAASQASDASKYTSSNFTSSTFVNTLAKTNPNPSTYGQNLASDSTRRANALAAGLPSNFFYVNPTVMNGGAWLMSNGGFNYYDSMQIELRRRMSKGLMIQSNYTWSKALSSQRVSFRNPWVKSLSSQLPHTFKLNWLYEMPFGNGRTLLSGNNSVVERIVGGWEFQGVWMLQSGNLLDAGNVVLVGMTDEEFQNAVGVRFDDAKKIAYYVPQDIITNTIAAMNTSPTTSNGFSTSFGAPTGRYIAPANQNSAGCIQVANGDCAPLHHYVSGPYFQRFDLSLVKRIRFSETKNFELRGEFLNAFNIINFTGVMNPGTSQTWGQVTSAARDLNQAQNPGGRLVQIVLRLNF